MYPIRIVYQLFLFCLLCSTAKGQNPDDVFWDYSISANGSGPDAWVVGLVSFHDKLYAGGLFTHLGTIPANHVASWDGTRWEPLGPGLNNNVLCLTTFQGELVAGGVFGRSGADTTLAVAVWNGAVWSPLGSDLLGSIVTSLIVHDGHLYAGGSLWVDGVRCVVAQWDGQSWNCVAPGDDGLGFALSEYNGAMVGATFFGSDPQHGFEVRAHDGESWHRLGEEFDGDVRALAVFESMLVAGGDFTQVGGMPSRNIAAWDGEKWIPLGDGLPGYYVTALYPYQGHLIAGGDFILHFGDHFNHYITSWNGSEWSPLGSGAASLVVGFSEFRGELFVGGGFTTGDKHDTTNIAGWTKWGTRCLGLTDNIDCDSGEGCDMSDLTRLIDYLYISHAPLCWPDEANVDGSADDIVDISDLSRLIDHLYFEFAPLASCR